MKLFLLSIIILSFFSCSKGICRECVDCNTYKDETICESDGGTPRGYTAILDERYKDGCKCSKK